MQDICPSCQKNNHDQCWGYKPREGCFNSGFECTCELAECRKCIDKVKAGIKARIDRAFK